MLYSSWPGYIDRRAGVDLNAWGRVRRPHRFPVPFQDLLSFGGHHSEVGAVRRESCTSPADDATVMVRRVVVL